MKNATDYDRWYARMKRRFSTQQKIILQAKQLLNIFERTSQGQRRALSNMVLRHQKGERVFYVNKREEQLLRLMLKRRFVRKKAGYTVGEEMTKEIL